jgi:hypothetical protein
MAIEFNDQLEAVWQVMYESGNWLAAVSRQPPPGVGFKVVWRFRYYVDDDLTRNSKDAKSWYEASVAETQLKEVLKKISVVVRAVVTGKRGQLYQLFREGRSTEEFLKAFTSLPHMHSETLDADSIEGRS